MLIKIWKYYYTHSIDTSGQGIQRAILIVRENRQSRCVRLSISFTLQKSLQEVRWRPGNFQRKYSIVERGVCHFALFCWNQMSFRPFSRIRDNTKRANIHGYRSPYIASPALKKNGLMMVFEQILAETITFSSCNGVSSIM